MSETNFEISVEIDGKTPFVEKVENGEMTIKISQSKYGLLIPSLTIKCVEDELTVKTSAFCGNNLVWQMKTEK